MHDCFNMDKRAPQFNVYFHNKANLKEGLLIKTAIPPTEQQDNLYPSI